MKNNRMDVPPKSGGSPKAVRDPRGKWDRMRATAEDAELVATSEEGHAPEHDKAVPHEEETQAVPSEIAGQTALSNEENDADESPNASLNDAMRLSPGRERAGKENESLASSAGGPGADAEPEDGIQPNASLPPVEERGYFQVLDSSLHTGEGSEYRTKKEWRTKLAELIEGAQKGGKSAKEKASSAYEHSAEVLSARSTQLSVSLRNLYAGFKRDIGAVDAGFRYVGDNPREALAHGGRATIEVAKTTGEYLGYFLKRDIELSEKGAKLRADFKGLTRWYNGLDMRHKVYLSTALALGAGVTSGVFASVLVGGTFIQRALGTSGFYMNRMKGLDAKLEAEKHWLLSKDSAAWKRHAYVGALTAAYTGATLGGSLAFSHYLHEWLYGADHAASVPNDHSGASVPEASPVAVSHASQSHAPHPASPLSSVSAEAVARSVPAPEHLDASAVTLHANHVATAAPGAAPELSHAAPSVATEAFKGHGYEYMLKHGMWKQLQHAGLKAEDYLKPGIPQDKQSDLYRLLTANPGNIDRVVDQIARSHHFVLENGESVTINPTAHMTFDAHGNIELNGHAAAPPHAHTTAPYHPEGHVPATSAPTMHGAPALSPADTLNHAEHMAFEKGPTEMRAWLRSIGFHTHHAAAPDASQAMNHSTAPATHEGMLTGHPLAHPEQLEAGKYLTVDAANAHRYVSTDGHDVVYGGTNEEREALAFEWVTKDHTAVVYFDKAIRGILKTHHQLMRAEWIDMQGTTGMPFGSGARIHISPQISPVLQEGAKIPHAPSVDDLQRELPDAF